MSCLQCLSCVTAHDLKEQFESALSQAVDTTSALHYIASTAEKDVKQLKCVPFFSLNLDLCGL